MYAAFMNNDLQFFCQKAHMEREKWTDSSGSDAKSGSFSRQTGSEDRYVV